MVNFNEFWERNKPFLVHVLGGAGVFLVLSYFVLGLGSESAKERKLRKALTDRGAALQRQFGDRGGKPAGSIADSERELGAKIVEMCVRVPPDLAASQRLPTRFLAEKERECAELNRLASQAAVDVKVGLSSVDFHDDGTQDAEKYEEHWAALACFRRLLEAVIRSEFDEVAGVVVEGTETTPVPGDPAWSIARHGVTVEVNGPFQSFVKLYAELHQAGRFLQVDTVSLRPRPGDAEGVLQGTLTGWALRLVKTKERAKQSSPLSGGERFRR